VAFYDPKKYFQQPTSFNYHSLFYRSQAFRLKFKNIYQTADILPEKQPTFSRKMLMLELTARGGMRIGEVLKLKPGDIEDRKLILRSSKSGKEREIAFTQRRLPIV
jgi:integrase